MHFKNFSEKVFNTSLFGCSWNIYILFKDRPYNIQNVTVEMRLIMVLIM